MKPPDWKVEFETAESKRALTRQVFDMLAPRYELVCRGYSFGRDAAWKRALLAGLPDHPAPVCLDIACGTGALSRALAARYANGRVVGLDDSEAMLEEARAMGGARIEYARGNMQRMDWGDHSVDILTGGYALRNAPDFDATLREIARVLKPGGCAAFLDFCHSDWEPYARVVDVGLRIWGGLWGWALFRRPAVFTYVAESLLRYPRRRDVRRRLNDAGLRVVRSRRYALGAIEAIWCERTAGAPSPSPTPPSNP
ncbi:MAG: class I SAM-dependent methyltransferase [Kiritimatiellae bacterium]|nr:class I SAM-dependent methyltransferase [Kiritimatiellia bacterium]